MKKSINLLAVVAALVVLTGCDKQEVAPLVNKSVAGTVSISESIAEPWTVVCDDAGHYTFIEGRGWLWAVEEWDNAEAAEERMWQVKVFREERNSEPQSSPAAPVVLTAEDFAKYNQIHSRPWKSCPKTSF